MSDRIEPDRVNYVKSGRPRFFDDPVNDQLLAMIMALTGEVSVLRERLDTHERLAAEKGIFSAEEVNAFAPDTAAEEERAQARVALLNGVVSVLNEELARLRNE